MRTIVNRGRPSKKVHKYSPEGKFVKSYSSIAEFAREHGLSKNLFSHSSWNTDGIYELSDGSIVAIEKIGRVGVRKYQEYKRSPYVGQGKTIAITTHKKSNKGKVRMYDLDGDLMAEFTSIFHVAKLTDIHESTISGLLKKPGDSFKTHDGRILELLKYE